MRRNNSDLLVVMVIVLLAGAVSALSGDSSNALRAGLSLPFVLFLPGYALSAALIPDGRTGLAERLAFSVGLSIAIAILGGLVLNFLPSGLTAASWRFLLVGVTLTAAAYAFWRRSHARVPGPGPLVTQISFREAALVSSAALLIGLALGLGATGVDPAPRGTPADAPFTQLWALPARAGQQPVVQVGLRSYQEQRVTYRVTLEAGGRVLTEWPQVTLDNGAQWQAEAALPAGFPPSQVTVNAFRDNDPEPYRTVRLNLEAGVAP